MGTGIQLSGGASASGNRVYGNTDIGIDTDYGTVSGNTVYGNSTGVRAGAYSFIFNPPAAQVLNNLVYANSNYGLLVGGAMGDTAANHVRLVNNTVYQPVGDAVRVEQNSRYVEVRNNILRVDAGYTLSVANDSQVGFNSDYNILFKGTPDAHTGFWGSTRDSIAQWQSASGTDAKSTGADPLWVDINGADNVLGYSTQGNRGTDDNFQLHGGSPAIDHADSPAALPEDMDGFGRVDDSGTVDGDSGFTDMGAYEFRGNSNDVTPPTVIASNPASIHNGGSVTSINSIELVFSEELNAIDASAVSTYDLRGPGNDGSYDTQDDLTYTLTPAYDQQSLAVWLTITGNNLAQDGTLMPGTYRITIFGNSATSVHDLAGLRLDGDANGSAGGDYVREFTVEPQVAFPAWLAPGSAVSWDDSSNTLTVTGPATIIADPGVDEPQVNLTGSAAELTIAPTADLIVHLRALNLTGGATATIASLDAARTAANHRVLIVNTLTIDPNSTLDLADNDLIVDYNEVNNSSLLEFDSAIRTGFGAADWLGTGIVSSAARDDSNFQLGIAENASLPVPFGSAQGGSMFDGIDVDDTCVLVKFTHQADLNLDGRVTDDDGILFSTYYEPGAQAFWSIGDLNHDGFFTDDDGILFSTFYDASLPQV
jgi:hypothetical protein